MVRKNIKLAIISARYFLIHDRETPSAKAKIRFNNVFSSIHVNSLMRNQRDARGGDEHQAAQ